MENGINDVLVDGRLTHAPAELPPQIEIFTLRDSVPSQSFIIPAHFCRVDTEGMGRVLINSDILTTPPEPFSEYLRVIRMNEGIVVDMHTAEGFKRPRGFERLHDPMSFDQEKWLPIVGYITNDKEYDQIAELYRESFSAELKYAMPTGEPSFANMVVMSLGQKATEDETPPPSRDRLKTVLRTGRFLAGPLATVLISQVLNRRKKS